MKLAITTHQSKEFVFLCLSNSYELMDWFLNRPKEDRPIAVWLSDGTQEFREVALGGNRDCVEEWKEEYQDQLHADAVTFDLGRWNDPEYVEEVSVRLWDNGNSPGRAIGGVRAGSH